MKKKLAFLLTILVFCVLGVRAEDPDVEKALEFQKALQQTIKKVTPAFVFFGNHGSGICISSDGYVVTNEHVARAAKRSGDKWKNFHFSGGKKYSGRIVWYDPAGDIALCKLDLGEGDTTPFVSLGNSDNVKVGDHALAVGNPFSLGVESYEPSVSLGVVSAVRRFKGKYSEVIQTDAKINPGNSGGPLFNMNGEVIGINSIIEVDPEHGRCSIGIGYAVCSTQIKRFIEHNKGKFEIGGIVSHGRIDGLTISEKHLGRRGGKVSFVAVGSTADDAGFESGDIITKIAGKPVLHPSHVNGVVHTYPAGVEIGVTIERDGEEKELSVKLDRLVIRSSMGTRNLSPNSAFFGVGTKTSPGGGIEVTLVSENSAASEAGMQVGDIILKIEGRAINDGLTFGRLVRRHKPGDVVKVLILRDGEEKEIEVKLTRRGRR
jgi:serine protease Do